MKLTETIFYRGQAIGRMCEDTNAGRVTFQPIDGYRNLACRRWAGAKACRKAVTQDCQKKRINEVESYAI